MNLSVVRRQSSARRLALAVSLLALISALAPLAPGAAEADEPMATIPGLPVAANLTTSPLARGTVVDEAGNPVAGALVLLYPETPPASIPKVGGSTTIAPLSQSVTDTSGRWVAKLPSDADLTDYVVHADQPSVNFFVQAWTPQGGSSYSFTVPEAASAATASMAAGVAVHDGGRTVRLDATASSAESSVALDISDQAVRSGTSPSMRSLATAQPNICQEDTEATYTHRVTKVGSYHSRATKTHGVFTFTKGTSSTLGVGWSESGEAGDFSVGGDSSVGISVTQGYPTRWGKKSVNFETYFTYVKILKSCVQASQIYSNTYYLRPKKFEGGEKLAAGPSVNYHYCRAYPKGSYLTVDHGSAYEYHAGVTVLGLGLSAQSGWNTHISETVYFALKRRLCGLGDYPGSGPKSLQVKYPA